MPLVDLQFVNQRPNTHATHQKKLKLTNSVTRIQFAKYRRTCRVVSCQVDLVAVEGRHVWQSHVHTFV